MTDITREEALKRIQHLFNTDRWDFVCSIDKDSIRLAYKALENQKTGHWIDKGSLSCRCSECGCKSNKETRFCANCGAKMEGENNEI